MVPEPRTEKYATVPCRIQRSLEVLHFLGCALCFVTFQRPMRRLLVCCTVSHSHREPSGIGCMPVVFVVPRTGVIFVHHFRLVRGETHIEKAWRSLHCLHNLRDRARN